MNRRYLRPIKLRAKSKEFYVFDTETGIVDPDGTIRYFLSARPEHLIFGVVYGSNGFIKVLYSAEEFKNEFKKKRYKNKIVFAHNAEYDLSAVYGNIYYLDPGAIFNGKFITCRNGVCSFADSFNLLPTSIEKLGELIGFKKQKLGYQKDKKGNLLSHVNNIRKDIQYCIADCKIAYDSLFKLFRDSEPSYTIGSLSLKQFRSKFLKQTIKINSDFSDQFFECLYGGRTEAFRIGLVNAFVYDINSAYPYAMKVVRFPDPSRLRYGNISEFEMYLHDLNFEGMIEATVTVDDSTMIPVLPFRTPDSLIFPVGTFRGSWTFNEFRYARSRGNLTVNKVHKLIIAESVESPFVEYIDHYYGLRSKTSDEFERYYYKLYMNNLYGKLIQYIQEQFRFCEKISDAKQFMREKNIKHAHLEEVNGGFFLQYEIDKILDHTIACWGAYITAEVRKMLHIQLMKHPRHIVYCDTDSNFSLKYLGLDSKKLGEWKKEDKTVIEIRALKDYVSIEKDKDGKLSKKEFIKGIKRGSVQLDQFANVFKIKRMVKTRESLRRVDNLPPGTFIEHMKVLTGDYKKRHVLPDGSTKPFKLKNAISYTKRKSNALTHSEYMQRFQSSYEYV